MHLPHLEVASEISSIRVRLTDTAPADDSPRLYVTRGVENAEDRVVNGIPYRKGALVPKPPWAEASTEVRAALLTNDENPPFGTTIDVLPAPPGIIEPLRAIGFTPGKTTAEYNAAAPGAAYLKALRETLPLLDYLVESEEGLQLLGICTQTGGLWSTTTHIAEDGSETFSGLHVDNWDKRRPGERHLTRRQMSINVGYQDRFLVFVARQVDEIAETIEGDQGYTGYARVLFARAPQTALFKVRVRPGEMYLAPTDNLIHDGTSVGADGPDITLNLRGHFHAALPSTGLPAIAIDPHGQ